MIAGSSWRSEPAAAFRGLAKVRPPGLGLAGVERGEVGVAHVDLAAHLEDRPARRQPSRDVGDGADVGGDVLAGLAVAAGRGVTSRPPS